MKQRGGVPRRTTHVRDRFSHGLARAARGRCRGAIRAHGYQPRLSAPLAAVGRPRRRPRKTRARSSQTVTAQREDGRGPTFGIVHDGALAGIVGYLPIDRVNRCGEIGYWLAEQAQGTRRHDAMLLVRRALRLPHARSQPHPNRGRHRQRASAARSPSVSASSSRESCAAARISMAPSSITRCTRCCAASSRPPQA